jgi:hypothetical protein
VLFIIANAFRPATFHLLQHSTFAAGHDHGPNLGQWRKRSPD